MVSSLTQLLILSTLNQMEHRFARVLLAQLCNALSYLNAGDQMPRDLG
jgi:hypothetical protein